MPLFVDNMIIYVEGPQESTEKANRTSKFSKITENKVYV